MWAVVEHSAVGDSRSNPVQNWVTMFLRMAALGEGEIGITLKEELNCGYEIVLGPGTSRVYQFL